MRDLQQKIEQRQFDDALQAADRLLAHFPGHRDLLYMRAVALRHLDRVPDALATLDALEDMHPTYPRLFQERGHCHVFLRQAPQAIQAFSQSRRIEPCPAGQLANARIAVRDDGPPGGGRERRPHT